MKKMVMILLTVYSVSAFADSSNCKSLYINHYERLAMLHSFMVKGEITPEFYDLRLKDESDLVNISEGIMCKGVKNKKRAKLNVEALYEVMKR